MANETEINRLFADCAHGAVPAIGRCYGLDLIVDDSIRPSPTSISRPAITRRCSSSPMRSSRA
ncbi:hypothetical protein ABIB73_006327 [Bradyrhizobium sp. F1.4.3]|uniref:hypothetical protein n=1 Tax=Bradyrhizobium sp. F1.4.3 TaxID=3156356 RepID=UPI00339B8F1A